MSEATHFPRLQHLHLEDLLKLNETPSSVGDIPTLQSITVLDCSDSAADSAQTIRAEQHELGNEDLQLHHHKTNSASIRTSVQIKKSSLTYIFVCLYFICYYASL